MTDWLIERLPLEDDEDPLPFRDEAHIFLQTLTWSNPAFERESEAITSSSVTIPKQ